ncbi:N-glycosylase/DNA lyase [Archaeoglobus veneficus]|uniref:8-oxoguanine DNA glycosylase/AP lyase n=1 Tax=Archaeoglobus veneficus (strain DSM 11195 / SNP6) TaxID=693661 RepID=F2KRP6_ARCVS|nr:N-glycosylase/DNA lyase [Archaeoglobus veneficus]AEA47910.1 N-glycosylase/DNA lyase [Archaeoglobus veneficus SNP6]
MELIEKVEELKHRISDVVDRRIAEFMELHRKGNREWFLELCFCILTANSSAELGIKIQNEIGEGFLTLSEEELAAKLKLLGHRFYNVRAKYIVSARKFERIKEIVTIMDPFEAREWLVDTIKGIGYKEASHFLRNVGYLDFAILDRHILRIMSEYGLIEIPKSLSRKRYIEIEEVFKELARKVSLRPGELDLYLWYMKTGKVLK